jgi:hypothetical protein
MILPTKIDESTFVLASNGRTGYIKKKERDLYVLALTNPRIDRSRWGNAQEITADAEHFVTYGVLPPAAGERW